MPLGPADHTRHFWDFPLQLQDHVYRRSDEAFDRGDAARDRIKTAEDVRARQEFIRQTALASVGGLPELPAKPHARKTGELVGDGFRVEKLALETLPGVDATCAFYIPDKVEHPSAALVFVCGHSMLGKAYEVYQSVCRLFARNGLPVLAVDPFGQGERFGYLDASGNPRIPPCCPEHDHAGMQCWLLGHSPARYFIHDARTAIAYLRSLDWIDPGRIGITGNSGGGTQTTWMMMIEPTLAAAAPGTFVMDRRSYLRTGQAQDSEQIIPGGSAAGLDHEDFLIAMAPRPVVVLAAEYDFFPIEGTRATFERAKRIYGLLGAEGNLTLVTDQTTHAYSPALARGAAAFFCRHLQGKDAASLDLSDPGAADPASLNVTKSGQVKTDRPDSRMIFDLNLHDYEKLMAARGPADHVRAREWIAEKARRHRRPCALNPRWVSQNESDGLLERQAFWFSEQGVANGGRFFTRSDGGFDSVEVALFDRGCLDIEEESGLIRSAVEVGKAVFAVDVRAMGRIESRAINPRPIEDHYGTIFKLTCDLVCLDDDLASMRVYDVLRALELVRTDPRIGLSGRSVRLFGKGLGGYYAYLAGAIDQDVAAVEVEGLLFSMDSVVRSRFYKSERMTQHMLFGQAAVFDLPDLLPLYEGREITVRRPLDAEGNTIISTSR